MGQATTDTPGRETGTPAESFPDFYRRHSGALFVFFARRVIDVEVARDLTAETFAQAFEHRHRRHGRRDPDAIAWLYGIARHQLSRYWRRGRAERKAIRRLGIQLGDIADDDLDRAVALADLDALRGAVASALERLSEKERSAVALRVVKGLSYPEVARALGVREPAARTRVARGLRHLAHHLDSEGADVQPSS
ncbi:MAG: sigma-70 family RNA polymerase sigma factor [Solirubrobacterales bacterium]|nr:sigma-70 family RNA polymerase sigma factor [Solirubrobacterales bacterium]